MTPTKARKRPPAKAGRKPFRPDDDQRIKVRVLKTIGMAHMQIAHVIGVAPMTLEKHFRNELDNGRSETIAEITMARYKAAMDGNAGAQAKFLEQAGVFAPVQVEVKAPPPAKEPKPPKLGKKEQRRLEAEAARADEEWSRLLPQ